MPAAGSVTPKKGCVVFFTGLSGAGKSTLSQALVTYIQESFARPVTLLDGDEVRKLLSSELGFSREHRDLNILRIGFVASEVARHGGMAVCAPIAPYDATRKAVRTMVEAAGAIFIEVYVATPLNVCEARDPKGLYKKARAGEIALFTGVTDPYEAPDDAEIVIDTREYSPSDAVQQIVACLRTRQLLS